MALSSILYRHHIEGKMTEAMAMLEAETAKKQLEEREKKSHTNSFSPYVTTPFSPYITTPFSHKSTEDEMGEREKKSHEPFSPICHNPFLPIWHTPISHRRSWPRRSRNAPRRYTTPYPPLGLLRRTPTLCWSPNPHPDSHPDPLPDYFVVFYLDPPPIPPPTSPPPHPLQAERAAENATLEVAFSPQPPMEVFFLSSNPFSLYAITPFFLYITQIFSRGVFFSHSRPFPHMSQPHSPHISHRHYLFCSTPHPHQPRRKRSPSTSAKPPTPPRPPSSSPKEPRCVFSHSTHSSHMSHLFPLIPPAFFFRCFSLTNPFSPYVTPHFPYITPAFF